MKPQEFDITPDKGDGGDTPERHLARRGSGDRLWHETRPQRSPDMPCRTSRPRISTPQALRRYRVRCRASSRAWRYVPRRVLPGASSNITIRGVRSFSGNNAPLYVIDGMPVESTPRRGADGQLHGEQRKLCRPFHRHQPRRHRVDQRAQRARPRPPSTAYAPPTA